MKAIILFIVSILLCPELYPSNNIICISPNQLKKIDANTYSFGNQFLWSKACKWEEVAEWQEILKSQHIDTFNLDENKFNIFWKNLESSFNITTVIGTYDLRYGESDNEQRLPQGLFALQDHQEAMVLYSAPLGLLTLNQLYYILGHIIAQWADHTQSVFYVVDKGISQDCLNVLNHKWEEWKDLPHSVEENNFFQEKIVFKYKKDIQKMIKKLDK